MARKTTCLKFGEFEISLNFKKGVKNLRLRVDKNAKISMSLPFYSTQKSAILFLQKHEIWLKQTHERILKNLPRDDEFWLLGKKYLVKFDPNLKETKIINDEIFTPNLAKLAKFKKDRAKKIYHELIAKLHPLINKPINRVVVREMSTRWGSCNSHKGYINLSLNLISKPLMQVQYVVLHELTHLIYPHHRREFYEFIERVMPDFKEHERALNGKNL